MPIQVTCPGCMTRFKVSEKFAGKQGPCPKCKKTITIPSAEESVVVHAPENLGPADQEGRPILKPLTRKETSLSPVQITIIAATIIGFLIGCAVIRFMIGPEKHPFWLTWVGALAMAVPVVYGAYTFLRNQELGSFLGRDLWLRVIGCSVIYAVMWFAMPLCKLAFLQYGISSWATALVAMIIIGAAVPMLLLDMDYMTGLVHYGLYLAVCMLGRFICGIGALPGMQDGQPADPEQPVDPGALPEQFSGLLAPETWTSMFPQIADVIAALV